MKGEPMKKLLPLLLVLAACSSIIEPTEPASDLSFAKYSGEWKLSIGYPTTFADYEITLNDDRSGEIYIWTYIVPVYGSIIGGKPVVQFTVNQPDVSTFFEIVSEKAKENEISGWVHITENNRYVGRFTAHINRK